MELTPDSARLLVVDDSPVNRQMLQFILRKHYPDLSLAEDGLQCLEALQHNQYDLLLLDLNMPRLSGFEVLAQLQQLDGSLRPAVIVVSADNDPTTISQALKLGASDYVATPFNRDELLARVGTHLALRSREQDLEARVQARTAELEATNQRLRETQGQLIQAEKMASLGLLSAGIAHEINNPIGYINSNLASLRDYLGDLVNLIGHYQQAETSIHDPDLRRQLQLYQQQINLPFLKEDVLQLIEESLQGVRQVSQIVTDLKVFSHPEQRQWERLALPDCLHSVLNIVKSEIKYKAEVRLDLAAGLPEIECITTQIYQVMTNLIINAAQAIEERGQIQIRLRQLDAGTVEIQVCDTGAGMEPEIAQRIFDPFFTTKAVGQGTGLGLTVSYGIVEAHRGTIRVQSRPGEGSCFIVQLPIHQQGPASVP